MIAGLPPREGTLARAVYDHVLASPVPLSRRQVCDWFLTATDYEPSSVRNTYNALAKLGGWQRYVDRNGGVYHGRAGLRFCPVAASQDRRRRLYGNTRTGVIARAYATPVEPAPVRLIAPADYRPAHGAAPMAAQPTEPKDRVALRGLLGSLMPHAHALPADVRLHVQRGLDILGDLAR